MVNYIFPIFRFATQTFNGGYEKHWGRGRILLGLSTSSIHQNSNMTPRLSGHFSIFGLVFFVFKSRLGTGR